MVKPSSTALALTASPRTTCSALSVVFIHSWLSIGTSSAFRSPLKMARFTTGSRSARVRSPPANPPRIVTPSRSAKWDVTLAPGAPGRSTKYRSTRRLR